MRTPHLGKLPPRYKFALNSQSEYRATRCPNCNRPTKARKFALLIHIDPHHLIALGKTCRYCTHDDLIIAHQDELEQLLGQLFSKHDPSVIGNDYLVIGTVEHAAWRAGLGQPKMMDEMLEHTADFKQYLQIEYELGGWHPVGRALQRQRSPEK